MQLGARRLDLDLLAMTDEVVAVAILLAYLGVIFRMRKDNDEV